MYSMNFRNIYLIISFKSFVSKNIGSKHFSSSRNIEEDPCSRMRFHYGDIHEWCSNFEGSFEPLSLPNLVYLQLLITNIWIAWPPSSLSWTTFVNAPLPGGLVFNDCRCTSWPIELEMFMFFWMLCWSIGHLSTTFNLLRIKEAFNY